MRIVILWNNIINRQTFACVGDFWILLTLSTALYTQMNYEHSIHNIIDEVWGGGPNLLSSYLLNEAVRVLDLAVKSRSLTSPKPDYTNLLPERYGEHRLYLMLTFLGIPEWMTSEFLNPGSWRSWMEYYLPPLLAIIGLRRCPIILHLTHLDAKALQ